MKLLTASLGPITTAVFSLAAPALADPPTQSGPIVTRIEIPFINFMSDTKADLTAVIGFDADEICAGTFDFDSVDLKVIDVPSADERVIEQFSGHVRAAVWPGAIPDGTDPCDFIVDLDPLAEGWVAINGTDNDVFLDDYDNTNVNAYGYNAHGELFGPSGQSYNFHITWRVTYDGADFFEEKLKIKFK